jgi:hypothetical protein
MVMAAVLMGSCAVVLWVATAVDEESVIPAYIASALTVPLGAGALRKWFTGLSVGSSGMRIRTVTTTETFRWSDISGFDTQPILHQEHAGRPRRVLRVITGAGVAVETKVIQGNYWDSPAATRPMFGSWSWLLPSSYPSGGIYLTDREFDAVVARLRAELADVTRSDPDSGPTETAHWRFNRQS